MPLLVVPLAPEEVGQLTLDEWDRLLGCEVVWFERSDHPLRRRLVDRGTAVADLPAGIEPTPRPRQGLVVDPASVRIVDLARGGAEVMLPATTPDALTAAHAAPLARRTAHAAAGLAAVMARLRSEDGCPWDRQQTHRSLQVHLLEETHEVLDAIESDDSTELREELGDLLLQVVFHAQLARGEGDFDLADVAEAITAKLLNRHPHVFGDVYVSDASEVVANWEAIKSDEKKRSSPFEGIPRSLPALLGAYKTQKRAARLGFTADDADARRNLAAALDGRDEPAIGEVLFWVVALARARGVDPETALLSATRRFTEQIAAR